jgi:hypothetical protein
MLDGSNLTARISAALTDAKYTDALVLLSEMRIRNETPSLGALCRWVRSLDVVSGLERSPSNAIQAHTPKNQQLLRVLDAILRVTGPVDENLAPPVLRKGPIAVHQTWDLYDPAVPRRPTRAKVLDRSLFASTPTSLESRFRILETIPGSERKPPNHHPAVLFTSEDNTIPLAPLPSSPTAHHHSQVPNLTLIKDILTPKECEDIIAAAESLGFLPDAPITVEGDEGSVLAHNFYWMVDQAFHGALWARVVPFVPNTINGKQVRGINRRFRMYRYVPGAEYRCHIGKCI